MCQATTAFVHVMMGLLVPLAVAAYTWPPNAAADDAATAQQRGIAGKVQRAVDKADDALRWVLGVQAKSLAARMAVLTYWAGAVWLLCST